MTPDSANSTPAVSGAAPARAHDTTAGARLLVLLLALAWGFNWIGAAIALRDISPWALRFAGVGIGAAVLFAAAALTRKPLRLPRGEWIHVMIAGLLNVTGFQLFSGFAQLNGATSRAIIITYSMPIWTTVLGRIVLGEELTPIRRLAFALCVAGLGILLWPLFTHGIPVFVFYSLGCALSWAVATVYIKWAKVTVPPIANAAWQLLFGWAFITIAAFAVEGTPRLWPLETATLWAIFYVGVFGVGIAHFLWWTIVGKLPAVTASIGSLLTPVVGIAAAAVILGERPSIPDIIGFISILAAAACVLLQPAARPAATMPE
jgi:drug/metabolite transporter (DMT)-like permease